MANAARSRFIATIAAAVTLGAFGALVFMPHGALAQGISLVPDCARFQTTTPGLDCVLDAFLGFARFILSITGSVALLIFVLAGFMYLINAGNPEQAKKATAYITNAAIGLVIIFCSGILVNYLQRQLLGRDISDDACTSLGNGFQCLTLDAKKSNGIRCKPGLCLTNNASNYQCCQPAKEPFISETCKAEKGGDFSCMNTKDGTGCVSGLCPGSTSIQCCKSKTGAAPGGGGSTAAELATTSCSNTATGKFLGCTATDCKAAGQPCKVPTDVGANCLNLTNDPRCGATPLAAKTIYGCRNIQDNSLKGCIELPLIQFCETACNGAENCSVATTPDEACK